MATAYIREYANITFPGSAAVQAVMEPGLADQTVSTSGASAQSSAFTVNTRLIALSAPASQAVCYVVGQNPTATTGALRVPAGSLIYIGVTPGHKIALIDVA